MAGYAAMAQVRGGRVRALAWTGAPGVAGADVERDGAQVDGATAVAPGACLVHGAEDPTLADRWAWFREELGMMTFFLLDPESWR
jgi:hypothetical protein